MATDRTRLVDRNIPNNLKKCALRVQGKVHLTVKASVM